VHITEHGQALNESEGTGILTGGFSTGRELWGSVRNGVSLRPSFIGGVGSRQGSSSDKEKEGGIVETSSSRPSGRLSTKGSVEVWHRRRGGARVAVRFSLNSSIVVAFFCRDFLGD
jgi:hypothetical protein